MFKRFLIVAGFWVCCVSVNRADAGFGIFSLSTKAGLDVVQSNDTRHFFALQSDVATVFSKRLRLELSGEIGSGTDLDGTPIKSVGGGGFLRYLWPNESMTAFAYMGGGLGLNRLKRKRLILDTFEHDMQLTLHFILVGMEKHAMKGRIKALIEVRWVLGDEEDATALRTAVGLGVNFGKP
ncbi:MAG: hypothetical protein HOE48_14850 [Candidatus Latescibacteria bacterium]|jgi:hypothetical protein|nr:hypothetical protein [Candidatus Latescibacterota bacterium]MBT4139196.1 hypothetical protein [Candidatus Latescibacterota bacterium]MBT5829658.1 hypothetical protein [Candidatus Latescibacterota bacterium]